VKTLRILIIDDDPGCLDSLKSSLELSGYDCEAFTQPKKAVKAYKKSRHDIIITDMKMPTMTGLEVLKEIKSFNPDAKVIIITAYGDVETAIAAVNNHAYAFFGKPLNFPELMETIEKAEKDHEARKLTREEYEKLVAEYSKLKDAYQQLQGILTQKTTNCEVKK